MVKNPDQTRQVLLTTAFHEFHRHGYQAAGLDSILKVAGVTKGALYHHFANKQDLGLAVVDEVLAPWIRSTWIEPLEQPGNPIDGLLGSLRCVVDKSTAETMECGCPLNNLAQEMSPIDEAFRGRLEGIFVEWRAAIAAALRRGRSAGQVRKSIDPEITAAFIVAAFEGAIGSVKASRSLPLGRQIVRGLEEYIESLRPPRRGKAN